MNGVWKQIKNRLVASFIAIAIFLLSLAFYNTLPLLAFLIGTCITLAVNEYYNLVKEKGFEPVSSLGIVTAISYLTALYLVVLVPQAKLFPWIILGLSGAALFSHFFSTGKNPLINLALTLFPLVYLLIPLGISFWITYDFANEGPWWLLYLILMTKITDSGALFFGKLFGKHPLAGYISPKKTWEGAAGGFFATLLASLLFWRFAPVAITFGQSLLWAALLSIAAQFGDLAESLLKRDSGIKDSSRLPGLGGFLDVMDSLVFTTPLLYLFLLIR